LVRFNPKERQVLRRDNDVESLEYKKEAQAEGGRRFQREGPIMEKDLDIDIVVVWIRVTKRSRPLEAD